MAAREFVRAQKTPPAVCLAQAAMGCRFELVLHDGDPVALRAAGEEALREVARLDSALSIYKPGSEISRVNARAAQEPVRVSPTVFRLLRRAKALWKDSDGAFDPAVGSLMKAWDFVEGRGRIASADDKERARASSGMAHVELDEAARTVRFTREGVLLDLGAIGKGFALDEAVSVLREAGVANALLQGGTSAIFALGVQPDGAPWNVAVSSAPEGFGADEKDVLAVLTLENESLSVSAGWGKCFVQEGRTYGHVMDPRTGAPSEGARLAAVAGGSAADCDAWSTALLVLGERARPYLPLLPQKSRALVVHAVEHGEMRYFSEGIAVRDPEPADVRTTSPPEAK